ncbi:hypothetical protein BCR34DRAFT_601736 [Clohesyomyces aquaticus]|uniref:Uncharacterized protein n=1 Tax=Clohesyomyces aquaticus TaxID=1231657 RepID=A0A1Y1ZL67_9PLEO|nr:hypothetical protein BCR34DRAFT_601736 [Clohesyomyces aquaticus]
MDPQGPQTYRERLDAGEQHWRWKSSLRAILIVIGLIGLGCMAWATKTAQQTNYAYELDDAYLVPWSLITFTLTIIWCVIVLLVLCLRQPPRPVHPGVAVGLDLVLWLAYIPTAMFALIAYLNVTGFGSDGYISSYSSSGHYEQAPNGTWVFEFSSNYPDSTRSCDGGRSSYWYGDNGFTSCAQEDAFVNALWQSKNYRANVEVVGVVCQFIALLLHFILFVWACVDTNRRNSRAVNKDAEKLAAEIVMNMVRSGAIIQNPQAVPAAYMPPGNYSQYPQYAQQPQIGQMGQMQPLMYPQMAQGTQPTNNTTEYYQPPLNEKRQQPQPPMMPPQSFQQPQAASSNRNMMAQPELPQTSQRPEPPAKSAARDSTGPNSASITPVEQVANVKSNEGSA